MTDGPGQRRRTRVYPSQYHDDADPNPAPIRRERHLGTFFLPHRLLKMAALDAGVPLREAQIAARHADPRTTTVYDRRRQDFDKHAAYVVVAFVARG